MRALASTNNDLFFDQEQTPGDMIQEIDQLEVSKPKTAGNVGIGQVNEFGKMQRPGM